MATITHKGVEVHTQAKLPPVGETAPNFMLTDSSLKDFDLSRFNGIRLVLNIFPSIDTGVCAASVRRFNAEASGLKNTIVLNVSKDLPFAQKRFCAAEGLENVQNGSEYKNNAFSDAYGVKIMDGSLAGLMSRAVVVINEFGKVIYAEQVADIGLEPNYEAAKSVLL